jgi:hypothetical protein
MSLAYLRALTNRPGYWVFVANGRGSAWRAAAHVKKGRLNEEALENGDEIGRWGPMVVIGEQAIASAEPLLRHRGFRRGNEQMSCQILHGSLHGRRGNGNDSLHEGLLAPRLAEPGIGSRFVPGSLIVGLAAATALLSYGCGKRGASGTQRVFTATAVLPREANQTEGFDAAIRAAAVKMRRAGDQRHNRRQPDRPSLNCTTEKSHTYKIPRSCSPRQGGHLPSPRATASLGAVAARFPRPRANSGSWRRWPKWD